jgi:hypothetical protein
MVWNKAKELIYFEMVIDTKVIGKMIRNMDLENFIIRMESYIMVNGKTFTLISWKLKSNMIKLGLMIKSVDKVNIFISMVIAMLVI